MNFYQGRQIQAPSIRQEVAIALQEQRENDTRQWREVRQHLIECVSTYNCMQLLRKEVLQHTLNQKESSLVAREEALKSQQLQLKHDLDKNMQTTAELDQKLEKAVVEEERLRQQRRRNEERERKNENKEASLRAWELKLELREAAVEQRENGRTTPRKRQWEDERRERDDRSKRTFKKPKYDENRCRENRETSERREKREEKTELKEPEKKKENGESEKKLNDSDKCIIM